MAINEFSQPDPRDLELTRFLDQEHTHNIPSADPDPLLPFLNEYKSRAMLKVRTGPDPDLYVSIQKQIDREGKKGKIYQFHPAFWRVAAVLLVAGLLTLFYFIAELRQPDLLAESIESAVELVLADGSTVTLRPYSEIYMVTESDEEQRYKIRGEAYFNVEQIPHRDFFVMTDHALVQVTGTSFTLSSWGEKSRVYLESGSLLFFMPDGSQFAELAPGQFSHTFNGTVTPPQSVDDGIYLGWLRDELVMDSRPLRDIAAEISHHFNISITAPPAFLDEELSGTLLLEDPEQILQDIAISTGLNLEKINDRTYRLSEN